MKKRILYVEDELALGKIVKETLEDRGFVVHWLTDGNYVLKYFDEHLPDICILDIMLPNIDGYSLCSAIRNRFHELPIIFLTAKEDTSYLVKGFDAGGNDYIKKPFSIEELIARINNQLNSKAGNVKRSPGPSDSIKLGAYSLIPGRYELCSSKGIIKLSHREMEILNIFIDNMNKIIDRQELLLTVWGDDSFFNSRNLDVYINKIRNYFSSDPSICIQTLKGKGYLFIVPTET